MSLPTAGVGSSDWMVEWAPYLVLRVYPDPLISSLSPGPGHGVVLKSKGHPESTPSTEEHDFEKPFPLMKHIFGEAEERFGGWFDDDLSREAPFQKQVGHASFVGVPGRS